MPGGALVGMTTTEPTVRPVEVGLGSMAAQDVVAVARHGAPVALTEAALREVSTSRGVIEELAAAERPVYGAVSYTHLTLPTSDLV